MLCETCKTCKFWKKENHESVCDNPHFFEEYPPHGISKKDSLCYPYSEGGYFLTGPKFGCIHWRER